MQLLATLLGVVWIDLLLSGDNALVIAVVCQGLPKHQRRWGIVLGTMLAILLRILMAGCALFLLKVPFLGIVGGVLLIWIAVKMVALDQDQTDGRAAFSLGQAVMLVAVTDASMSLDNVMAVAAIVDGHWLLMIVGVALSIPVMIAGSTVISRVLEAWPILIWIGAGLLGWVAGGLMASDPIVGGLVAPMLVHLAGLVTVAVVAAFRNDLFAVKAQHD